MRRHLRVAVVGVGVVTNLAYNFTIITNKSVSIVDGCLVLHRVGEAVVAAVMSL
jgi:hypothetical protein